MPFATPRRNKTLLVGLLAGEVLVAYWLRWPLTTATLKTSVDYQLAQVVVAGENWRREGALARHFVPSRSIDQTLPEWFDRDDFWRDYLSQPPLAYMLEYWTSRLFSGVDPVLVGKVMAQVLTGAGVLLSAILLCDVFGVGATLIGLSFLVWGKPFLVWFIDGYYATTPALICQLVLIAWCLVSLQRHLRSSLTSAASRRDAMALSILAFLGAFSEWIALAGNAVAVIWLGALAVVLLMRRSARAAHVTRCALAILFGSAAAVAVTFGLFGSKVGYGFYLSGLLGRIDRRTSDGVTGPYLDVLIRQMQTAWPYGMLVVLSVMCVFVLLRAGSGLWTRRRIESTLILTALVLGFGSAATYTLLLRNLITIHWWFTGTWVLGWTMTLCTFASMIGAWIGRADFGRAARLGYASFCVAMVAAVVGWNVRFADLRPPEDDGSRDLYRFLGRTLPADGLPLVIADMPGLFQDYPFTTAYLRRALVRHLPDGAIVKLGTMEDARADLRSRTPFADVLYDPSLRRCIHDSNTPESWESTIGLALCRVPAGALTEEPPRLFEAVDADVRLARWVDDRLAPNRCCEDPQRLRDITRLVAARLLTRSAAAVGQSRVENAQAFAMVGDAWHRGTKSATDPGNPAWAAASIAGIIGNRQTWSVLITNLEGGPLPELRAPRLLIDGKDADVIVRAVRLNTSDGTTGLPLVVIDFRAPAGIPARAVVELRDRESPVLRAVGVPVAAIASDADAVTTTAAAALNGCVVPSAPDRFRVVANAGRTVTVAWRSPPVVMGALFRIEAGSGPGLSDYPGLESVDPTLTVPNLIPRTYFVRVRADSRCGVSAPSNELRVVVE